MNVNVYIRDKPTRKDLDEFYEDYREALRKGYDRVGRKVFGISKAKAPVDSGVLKTTLKFTSFKHGGFKVVHSANPKNTGRGRKPIPASVYAAAVHWGGRGGTRKSNDNQGYGGLKYLYSTVYPNVKPRVKNPRRAGPVATWIVSDIAKAIGQAVDAANRKGANLKWGTAR